MSVDVIAIISSPFSADVSDVAVAQPLTSEQHGRLYARCNIS